MEMGQKRFCQRVFLECLAKLANLGDLLTYAVFESYRRDFTNKIEVKNPNFVQALDKNVFVQFCPHIYRLSIGTMSLSASVSPFTTSKPYLFQSALRSSRTALLIFFPNNLLEIVRTSIIVGGRLRDLISSARRRTSASVGPLGFTLPYIITFFFFITFFFSL